MNLFEQNVFRSPSGLNPRIEREGLAIATLAQRAQELRHPHMTHLQELAQGYKNILLERVSGAQFELGGSLVSNTCLAGHQDIDMKLLIADSPEGDEAALRRASSAITDIIPFQKIRMYGGEGEQQAFALAHQTEIEDPLVGKVDVELLVCPARVYVGYAKYQAQLPQWMLDAYVIAKHDALMSGDKGAYKAVKRDLYAQTRALYHQGFFKK
ncbi:MAG: hypothetical protein WCJ70_04765 [bacterium]